MAKKNSRYLVFASSITLRNGKKIYAKDYGLKAFCFYAKRKNR